MTDAATGAAETPLQDHLRRIPRDAIYQWVTPEADRELWQLPSNSAPIGRLAHEAADRIDLAALSPEAPARECAWCDGRKTVQTASTDVTVRCGHCNGTGIEALTPRHEAPAEGAGELDDDDASTYEPSIAGLSDYLWNQAQDAESVESRCILEMWREAVDVLRARSFAPEAREGEAVAWRWRQRSKGPDAYWSVGHTPVDTGDAGETARIFEVQPLYTHPAAPSADKLRIAAEEFCRRVEAGEIRSKRSYAAFKDALKAEGA